VRPGPLAGALLVSSGMWLGLLAAWSWSAVLLGSAFLAFFAGAAVIGMSEDPR
jgi:hypothetical protein